MNILITHESSGVMREAWRAAGHAAWSCDLQPADDDSPHHMQCDAITAIKSRTPGRASSWDLIGMHPPCTYLTGAGMHWNNRGRGWENTEEAFAHVKACIAAAGDVPHYLENPVGIIFTRIRKPDQIIQPYEFGEDASKKTCLWLHRLCKLARDPAKRFPGRIIEWPPGSGKMVERWSNQTDSGQNRLPPSATRWKERSKSYPGIAQAMAEQWTNYLAIEQLL